MGDADLIQLGDSDLFDLCPGALELLQHRLADLHHLRRGVLEPVPVDAQAHAVQIGLVPACQRDRRLDQRIGLAWVGSGDQRIGQRGVFDAGSQRAEVRHAPA